MIKLLALFLLISSSQAAIQVLGSNGETEQVLGTLSQEEYSKTLLATKLGIDQEIIAGLSRPADPTMNWKLSRISIGLGATGEIGVGPYKLGTAIKQRFIYAR